MSPTHSIAESASSSLKKQRAPKEDIDFALDQIDMYRMRVPRDGNSLLRCMALQLYNTQIFFTKMRAALVRYMERHPEQYERRASLQSGGTYEQYLENLSRDGVECGSTVEITALSALYQCNIYQHDAVQAARPRPLSADRSYRTSIFLYSPTVNGDVHFDLVLPKVKLSIAGMCQGITYNCLYSRVFGLGSAVDMFVHLMLNNSVDSSMNSPLDVELAEKLGITTDMPVGLLTPSFGGHAVPDGLSHTSPRGQIIDDIRTVLQELGPPFPYKVAKSIATFVYRNPDQDVYAEKTKEKHRNKRRSDAGLGREESGAHYSSYSAGSGQWDRDYGYPTRQSSNYQQTHRQTHSTGYGLPVSTRPYFSNQNNNRFNSLTSPNFPNDMPLSPSFPPPMLLSPQNFTGFTRPNNGQPIYGANGGFKLMPPPATAQQYSLQQQYQPAQFRPNFGGAATSSAACYSPLPTIPSLPQPTARFNNANDYGNLCGNYNPNDAATVAAVNAAAAGAWLEAFNHSQHTPPFIPPQPMNSRPLHFQYNNTAVAAAAGGGGNAGRYFQQPFFSSPIPSTNFFPLSPTPGGTVPSQPGSGRVPSAQRAPPPLSHFFSGPPPSSPFFSVPSPVYGAASTAAWSPIPPFNIPPLATQPPPPLPSAQQLLTQRFGIAAASNFGFPAVNNNFNDGDFGSAAGLWKPPVSTAAVAPVQQNNSLHRGYRPALFQYGNRGSPIFNQSSGPLFESGNNRTKSNDPAVLRANFASPTPGKNCNNTASHNSASQAATVSPSSGVSSSSFPENDSSPDSPHSSSAATDESLNVGAVGGGESGSKQGSPTSPVGSMRSSSAQAQPNKKKRNSEMSDVSESSFADYHVASGDADDDGAADTAHSCLTNNNENDNSDLRQ